MHATFNYVMQHLHNKHKIKITLFKQSVTHNTPHQSYFDPTQVTLNWFFLITPDKYNLNSVTNCNETCKKSYFIRNIIILYPAIEHSDSKHLYAAFCHNETNLDGRVLSGDM